MIEFFHSPIAALSWELMRPGWLWLLAVAAPLLLLFHFRSLSDFPRFQRRLSLVTRLLVVLLLVLALAGLVLLRDTRRQMVVIAVDQSASIDAAAAESANAIVAEIAKVAAEGDVALRYLPFASQPGALGESWPPQPHEASRIDASDGPSAVAADVEAESRAVPQSQAESAAKPAAAPETDADAAKRGTDLAAAIQTAIASIPPSYVPRVVLLSDGNPTRGDAVAAAAAGDVPVWTMPLPARSEPEVQLAAVTAPAQVRQGEPFFVEVVVNANRAGTGYIDLYRGDIQIGEDDPQPVEIKEGENRFRFRQSVSGQRQVTFAARVRGFDDTLLDNNEASSLVYAEGRPRVLMIDPDTEQTDAFRWAMEEQEIDIEVRPPAGIPRDLAELQGYECLMLSNVAATSMTMRQMDLIRTYVQDLGGGMIMLGGDQSFGLGGYYRTQLEELLPVRSNFEKEREKPSLAMVLVIDKSGSMGGERIELAKDAAKAAVELLGPRDSVGILTFDGDSYWTSELRAASDKGYLINQISTIEASGGTNMYPAMEQAYEALQRATAKLKHCIVLTDGISSPGDFEGLAGEMAASRMTVSTVAMGQGSSEELLETIARLGGGRYYFCDDPQSVPQVFAKETVEASKSAINELPFIAQLVRPTQVLEGIDWELSPLLLGYVVTRPKPTSEFILASENGDPVLAWWRYGLGMTVAFTSDAKNRWAAEWLAWPEFGTFWAQIIRHAMRKNESKGVFVDLELRGGSTRVVMDAVDATGRFVDQGETTLTVVDPQLKTKKIAMRETAPGRYEATLMTDRRGAYQMDIAQTRGGAEAVRQSRGLMVGYPDELRLQPLGEVMLRQIAEVSGGSYAASAAQALALDNRSARLPQPLWPWLLMTALGLFVADVALRRIDLSRR